MLRIDLPLLKGFWIFARHYLVSLFFHPSSLFLLFRFSFKLGSPVLFRQARSGLHGRPFLMVKFRTMRDAFGPDGQPLPDADRTTTFDVFYVRVASTNYLSFGMC